MTTNHPAPLTPEELAGLRSVPHKPSLVFGFDMCTACGFEYPCPTSRLLDHVAAQEAEIAKLKESLRDADQWCRRANQAEAAVDALAEVASGWAYDKELAEWRQSMMEIEIECLEREVERLEAAVHRAKAVIRSDAQTIETLTDERDAARQEAATLRAQLADEQRSRNSEREKRRKAEVDRDHAKRHAGDMVTRVEELTDELRVARESIAAVWPDFLQRGMDLDAARRELETARTELARLTRDLAWFRTARAWAGGNTVEIPATLYEHLRQAATAPAAETKGQENE